MNSRVLLILALTLGLITSGLVFGYVNRLSQQTNTRERMVAVLVAAKHLPPKTVLQADMLQMQKVPLSFAHPEALSDVRQAVGRIVKEPILPGEQVAQSRLLAEGERPGLTYAIPPGKRAMSVAVNEVIGVAGFVKPGDFVDILGTFDEEFAGRDLTATILQNVQVLAISQDMETKENEKARVSTTVTLAVRPDEAEKLTLAEERGHLRMALRPLDANERLASAPTTTADLLRGGMPQVARVSVARPTVVVSRPTTQPAPKAPPASPEPSTVEVIRGTNKQIVELK